MPKMTTEVLKNIKSKLNATNLFEPVAKTVCLCVITMEQSGPHISFLTFNPNGNSTG